MASSKKKSSTKSTGENKSRSRAEKVKLGLALSGGGFRATAFHLGVLKRLRELGVLDDVEVLSTVSGGSIAGAFYVYWFAIGGQSLEPEERWREFERRLVGLMRCNIRGRALLNTALLPGALAIAAMLPIMRLLGGSLTVSGSAAIVAGIMVAYYCWNHFCGRYFAAVYDRKLFQGAHLQDLPARRKPNAPLVPELFVNATALESGRQVLFTRRERGSDVLLEGSRGIPVVNIFAGVFEGLKRWSEATAKPGARRESLWRSAPFAQAVTASSSVPGVFPPVRIGSALESFRLAMARRFPDRFRAKKTDRRRRESFLAVDGGVFDNQGIQALLESDCSAIIVSDASAVTVPLPGLSMRDQLSQLKRSQDIIFSRVRNLCYRELEMRHAMGQLLQELQEQGISHQKRAALRKKHGLFIVRHGFINFNTRAGLPNSLRQAVSEIRTDLDCFSALEIVALMYQGYEAADSVVRGKLYGKSRKRHPARYMSDIVSIPGVDWEDLTLENRHMIGDHLRVSSNRWFSVRWCVRRLLALKSWVLRQEGLIAIARKVEAAWKTIHPGWERVPVMTVTRETPEGKQTSITYDWRRLRPLRTLARRFKSALSQRVAQNSRP